MGPGDKTIVSIIMMKKICKKLKTSSVDVIQNLSINSSNQKNNLKKFIRELFVKGQIIRTTKMATNTGKIQTLTFDIIIIQPAN